MAQVVFLLNKRICDTKIVVTQDFSPAPDSSTAVCHQGYEIIHNPTTKNPPGYPVRIFG